MGKLVDDALFTLVRDFLKVYLPNLRKCSPNTIRSYQKALEMLLDFVKVQERIKLHQVTLAMLDKKRISDFLDYLEKERGCSTSTRNHRLQCIRSFFSYAAENDIGVVKQWQEIKKIKTAIAPKTFVEHMSESAIESLLAQPNVSTRKGLRDFFIMLLLYQTGARIQELLDIRICDIRMTKTPTITLCGKGNKVRIVPLRDKVMAHLKQYIAVFHPDENNYSKAHLFYVLHGGSKCRMTEDNARRLVQTYGLAARKVCSEVPEYVHPHLFRHSRAMHLYQNGVDLTLVSQWLGHAKLETTFIYAHADTELKRKAIENAVTDDSPLKPLLNAGRYNVEDDDTLKRLYGLA